MQADTSGQTKEMLREGKSVASSTAPLSASNLGRGPDVLSAGGFNPASASGEEDAKPPVIRRGVAPRGAIFASTRNPVGLWPKL